MAGGVSHNIGQLIVAMLAVETYQVGYYLPVLLIAGLITGAVIGAVAGEVLKRIRNIEGFEIMISYIRGELAAIDAQKAIVDVAGGIRRIHAAAGSFPASSAWK